MDLQALGSTCICLGFYIFSQQRIVRSSKTSKADLYPPFIECAEGVWVVFFDGEGVSPTQPSKKQ